MNNNNWNTVDWDEIPEDVAAVVTYERHTPSYYKVVGGELYVQCKRSHDYEKSFYNRLNSVSGFYGEHCHLRPAPITLPTPETPESTQVESSEVETTTTPEFDWSSVEEDVEAVLLVGVEIEQVFKEEGDKLLFKLSCDGIWRVSTYHSIKDREDKLNEHGDYMSARMLRRPPAIIPSEVITFSHDDIKQLNDSGCFDTIKENPVKCAVTPEFNTYDIYKEAAINFKPDTDIYMTSSRVIVSHQSLPSYRKLNSLS